MAAKTAKKKEEKSEAKEAKEAKETTFKCGFCGESKPLSEMTVITRFFPQLVACRDCERKMR